MKCDHAISVDGIEYSLCDVGIACPYCRIAELEAQEMGFVQSLCGQSEDIGRLKQRIEALEAGIAKTLTAWHKWRNLKSGGIPYIQHYKGVEKAVEEMQALLPGRGDE